MRGNRDTSNASRRQRWAWALQIFIVLLLLWIMLNGLAQLWAGLIAALAGAAIGAWLASGQPHPWKPHRLLAFAGFFLWESLKGGIDVAWRAFHPKLPIQPGFTSYRMALPAGQPRTLMVSTVSLLPGTLSADLDDSGEVLEVHGLTPDAMDSVFRLEAWITWLFSLDR